MKIRSFSDSQTQPPGPFYNDFLKIYDGSNDQSTLIAMLSGNLGSFGVSGTGNSLFIKFESNFYDNYAGFFATIHNGN